jgi:hypothetical protein
MRKFTARVLAAACTAIAAAGIVLVCECYALPVIQPSQNPSPSTGKAIGAIKSVDGNTIILTPDSGPEVSIAVQPSTQLLRVEPGAKTLSEATPIALPDLQVGDRIRVTGVLAPDGHSLAAAKIVTMKHADLETRHREEIQDWQKRGVDGLATAVDQAAGTVTITVRAHLKRRSNSSLSTGFREV